MITKELIKQQFKELYNTHKHNFIKTTQNDVYGTEIIRVSDNGTTEKYKLEDWVIKLPFEIYYEFSTYIRIIFKSIFFYELDKVSECNLYFDDLIEYKLAEWEILDSEFDDAIVLVKHAKVLPKLKGE